MFGVVNVPIAPAYTINLPCLIASTAAMKNVLSPISVTSIIINELTVAEKKLLVTDKISVVAGTVQKNMTLVKED